MPISLIGPIEVTAGHHDAQGTCYTATTLSRYLDDEPMKLFVRVPHSGIGPIAPPLGDGKVVLVNGRAERAHEMGDGHHLIVNVADPGACFTSIPPGFGRLFPVKYIITGHLREVTVPSQLGGPTMIKLGVDEFEEARPYIVGYSECVRAWR